MSENKKNNFVIVVADQWRADSISYNGNPAVPTPHIDSLAEDGVGFSNAYCQNPVCVPSRSSFLTGWYPHTKGFRTMHHLMDNTEPNLLKTMKNAGYHVYWGGRNDFVKPGTDHSDYFSTRSDLFSEKMKMHMALLKKKPAQTTPQEPDYSHYKGVKETVEHIDTSQIEDAADFVSQYDKDDPFCVYLALSLPHPPYEVDEEWFNKVDAELVPDPVRLSEEEWSLKPSILRGIRENQKLFNWSDEELKKMKQVYYAMGMKLDQSIGELIHSLKDKGVYEETTIVFFSDHGDYTGDYELSEKNQNTFEDVLTNVPLVIKPSKDLSLKSRKTDALVELIDIQATIMDLAGITPTHTHFGESLKPVLEGREEHRDVVFSEGGRLKDEGSYAMDAGHTPENPYWARTTEQEKTPQHTKAMMIRDHQFKYVYRLYEEDEFYDLVNDPHERKNEIHNERFIENIRQFKERMLCHFFETSDVVPHERDSRF